MIASDALSWMAQGECNGADPALFFPGRGEDTGPAQAICRTCPVIAECLQYALHNGEKIGIWGGLSERQRRKIRRNTRTCKRCHNRFTPVGSQVLCSDACRSASIADPQRRYEGRVAG